jgi:hypothetical protein
MDPATVAALEVARQLVQTGLPPSQVADIVFDAIRQEKFYIFTHPYTKDVVQLRMQDILQERPPTDPFSLAQQAPQKT